MQRKRLKSITELENIFFVKRKHFGFDDYTGRKYNISYYKHLEFCHCNTQ